MNRKVNLFYNWYKDPIHSRNVELYFCYRALLKNTLIDRIFLLTEEKIHDTNDNVIKIPFDHQPTFREFMWLSNHYTGKTDINILINSDCYINSANLKIVKDNLKEGVVYCMTRWEIDSLCPFVTHHYGNSFSQDAWIITGKWPEINDGNYKMGQPGCDNALAFELNQAGLELKNPSFDVKVYHLHLSTVRTYNDLSYYYGKNKGKHNKFRVKMPFQLVEFTGL